ncbi:metalloprotease, partial [Thalassiosira pseudonana CCMP1335]
PGAVDVGHAAYDTLHSSWLEEYEARLTLYRHRATGAEYLAGYDPKPDKVFGVAFRTKPESSTGVPHILEHSVLCGSKKYPSRDPFAHLLKGSLQTFLNAMTYPDRTVYPVASRNKADFRNLMDVYLDAVFHPRAVEDEGWWVLRQEGWRYDDRALDNNGRAKFEYKGVVFSEMKGAYSDPEGLIDRITQSLLFPDNPYHFDSGGDPAIIPTLTREEFVEFHKKYYHPTNARLFVAGDESDVYHALSMADHYMTPMGYNPDSRKDSAIPYQQRTFHKPVSARKPFAVAASEDEDAESTEGFMLCVTWLLNTQPMTPMMELAWIVLDRLLLGKASSPLKKSLEDSGLGEEIIGNGVDDELLQSTFAIGMKGIKNREDVNALEDLIMDTFHKLDSDGFSEEEIASSMNTIEFRLREGGGGLRGMEVFLGALSKWNYDLSPKDALVYEDALKALKDELKRTGSNIFQQMIRDFLLTNNHRVVLELYPSTTLEGEQLKDQDLQISRAQSRMSEQEYQSVLDDGIKLKQLQETEESPEVIATNPALSISDIDTLAIEYPIQVEENAFKSGVRLITHEVVSSGIIYVRLALDVSMIPYEEVTLLPALITLLNQAGTSDQSDAEFRNHIDTVTGGVSADLELMTVKPTGWDDDAKVLPGVNMLSLLFISGKCTSDKIADLFAIFEKVLTDINFDDSKDILRNALKSSLSSKKSSVASSGHHYVDKRIRGRYSVRNYIDEKIYGVSSLDDEQEILDSIEADWSTFVLRLDNMRQAIVNGNRNGMLLDMTGDGSVLEAVMVSAEDFLLLLLPTSGVEEMMKSDPIQDEGIVVSTQVAYVGEGGRLYDVGEQVGGSTSVVSHYLTTGYMWDVIRAKNGAYGAYSKFSSSDGVATLYTYRDPNVPDNTLDAFHGAADSILQDNASNNNAAITTAIIGTIGSLDGSALSAEDAGYVALVRYLRGESSISRQKWRNDVIGTNAEDFVDFANRLKQWKQPSKAIVASQSAFD